MKVPGWSLVCNEHLTKTLSMFLTRSNEIIGGCQTIVTVLAKYPLVLNLYERFSAALNASNCSRIALLIATCPERLLYSGIRCNFNRVSARVS